MFYNPNKEYILQRFINDKNYIEDERNAITGENTRVKRNKKLKFNSLLNKIAVASK